MSISKEELRKVLDKSGLDKNKIDPLILEMQNINSKLWDIEDQLRNCEKNKKFDDEFINLARSVYITNDQRSQIKNEINKKYGSAITEVKSYKKY